MSKAGSVTMAGEHLRVGALPRAFRGLDLRLDGRAVRRGLQLALRDRCQPDDFAHLLLGREPAEAFRLAGDLVGGVWEVVRPVHGAVLQTDISFYRPAEDAASDARRNV